jgi:hypothetical protein
VKLIIGMSSAWTKWITRTMRMNPHHPRCNRTGRRSERRFVLKVGAMRDSSLSAMSCREGSNIDRRWHYHYIPWNLGGCQAMGLQGQKWNQSFATETRMIPFLYLRTAVTRRYRLANKWNWRLRRKTLTEMNAKAMDPDGGDRISVVAVLIKQQVN